MPKSMSRIKTTCCINLTRTILFFCVICVTKICFQGHLKTNTNLKECGVLENNLWSESSHIKPTLASPTLSNLRFLAFQSHALLKESLAKTLTFQRFHTDGQRGWKHGRMKELENAFERVTKRRPWMTLLITPRESRLTLAHSCTCYCPPMPLLLRFAPVTRPRALMEFSALALETWCHPHKLGLFWGGRKTTFMWPRPDNDEGNGQLVKTQGLWEITIPLITTGDGDH